LNFGRRAVLHPAVGDFDGIGFAIDVGDVAVGDVGVAVHAREDRIFSWFTLAEIL
jgi:hypothetical protein